MNATLVKKTFQTLSIVVLSASLAFAQGGGNPGNGGQGGQGGQGGSGGTGSGPGSNATLVQYLATLPIEALSAQETQILMHMREEEKLARDVYRVMAVVWNQAVFANIAQSEQQHMDLVKLLLDRYQLQDPVVDDSVGAFTDPALQGAFVMLIGFGIQSPLHALYVGALIEDVDLFDLDDALLVSDNRDLDLIWQNLAKGSRNHMRAFYGNLVAVGILYTPVFLDPAAFDAIITTPRETAVLDENGNPL